MEEQNAGRAIVALELAQFLFTSLVNSGAISKDEAHAMLARSIAENNFSAPECKHACHLLMGLRDSLEKRE